MLLADRQRNRKTDRESNMKKLVISFRSFTNASNNETVNSVQGNNNFLF